MKDYLFRLVVAADFCLPEIEKGHELEARLHERRFAINALCGYPVL